jgi:hypothetical protein
MKARHEINKRIVKEIDNVMTPISQGVFKLEPAL